MDVLTFHFVARLKEADVLARLEAAEAKIAALEAKMFDYVAADAKAGQMIAEMQAELQRRKGGRPRKAVDDYDATAESLETGPR